MATTTTSLWTIEELSAQVSLALAGGDYSGQTDARIREVPDRRTLRYYTTLGLLDRPAEMRGRTALYGHKHLLQVVAIKRLQTRGLTLVEIQERLVGATEARLSRYAQLPAGLANSLLEKNQEPASAHGRSRSSEAAEESTPTAICPAERTGTFWSARPAAPTAEPPGSWNARSSGATKEENGQAESVNAQPAVLQGVRLEQELTLLFPASRPIFEDDIEALRAAAAPLCKLLKKRRLM